MTITKATLKDLNELAPLFDGYRVFYKQTSNIEAATQFLKQRLVQNDSVLYIAFADSKSVGFMQLYPLFSSVSMQPMYVLNDLFIASNYRNQGIGKALIDKAKALCKEEQNKGLAIQTGFDNPAQQLYQRLGFEKDSDLHFFWTNN